MHYFFLYVVPLYKMITKNNIEKDYKTLFLIVTIKVIDIKKLQISFCANYVNDVIELYKSLLQN